MHLKSIATTAGSRFGPFELGGRDLYLILKGLLTWVPGVQKAFYDRTGGGGTGSAEYCYGVWLKHLCLLWEHGMRAMPRTVVELGPGASLGTGFAALLSGAERYIALDAVRHAQSDCNEPIFRGLIELFEARAPRPSKGWPDFDDLLDRRLFPSHILSSERLAATLDPERVGSLKGAIRYRTLSEDDPVGDGEADLVFSHVVLCHVDDLEGLYARCARYLKPGGWMSHQTDFACRRLLDEWNGHLKYGERQWKILQGRRPYFVSRERLSTHVELLRRHGFEIRALLTGMRRDGIDRARLAARWRDISDEDLQCEGAFLVARKL
jgi:SAM-dependent methyltransferase